MPPDSLLIKRPVSRVSDPSKKSIARGYISNTVQLGIANEQLEGIAEWKRQQIELHGVDPDANNGREGLDPLH